LEAVPIAEHGTRRNTRHAHGHNHDARARHYALRVVRQSPARIEAPEPDVWLPILDISGELSRELETLDITAELELFDHEADRADLDVTLTAIESQFWSTAARQLEEAVNLVAFVEPEPARQPEPAPFPDPEPVPDPEPAPPPPPDADPPPTVGPVDAPPIELLAEPELETAPAGLRARIRSAVAATDGRTRSVGALLVIGALGAFATVFPSVVGASAPQRYVMISLDGHTVARTVRVASVADVLKLEGITVHGDDRVVPAPTTNLAEGMHIRVLRAFPVDVEVNGVSTTVRTTARTNTALQRELGLDPRLVARESGELSAGSTRAFRTPHAATLEVDGRTITAPMSTALNVAGFLADYKIALGPRDEIMPAAETRLSDGMNIRVLRLADNQIAERVAVPFPTETRDDPNLRVGETRVIQTGAPGLRRDIFVVTTRPDGAVAAKTQIGYELLAPPVPQVIVEGTQPVPPQAVGSASWYGTGPGRGTCAHLSLPFGTVVTITNRDTGATAQCRVQDRGPEAWTGHIIDLAPDVFRQLAPLSQGIAPVTLSYSRG
jgi:resuscitation-promoting factor RpfB